MAPVQELAEGHLRLVGGHAPQVHLGLGAQAAQLVLGALDVLAGGLLCLGLGPSTTRTSSCLAVISQDARLELEHPVLVHRQDGAPGCLFSGWSTVSPFWAGRSMGGGAAFSRTPNLSLRLVEPVAQARPAGR